jgi:proline dehydrogenase
MALNRLRRLVRALGWRLLRPLLDLAGRAYVPGAQLEHALRIARALARENITCTIGYFQQPSDSPQRVMQETLAVIDAVAQLQPPGYVSLKAPALHYDSGLLQSILRAARERGVLAHFDSHEHATAEPTLACVRAARASEAKLGLTLPGRWRRSVRDAAAAVDLGLRARIVKGEWADPGAVESDKSAGFLDVVDALAGKAHAVAIATHDAALAREALTRLQRAGTACEMELLHGLPQRALRALARELSVPVRVYIPYGAAWRPYALNQLRRNPRILWWVVKDSMTGLAAKILR